MRIAIYPNVTKSGAGEILERVIKFAIILNYYYRQKKVNFSIMKN